MSQYYNNLCKLNKLRENINMTEFSEVDIENAYAIVNMAKYQPTDIYVDDSTDIDILTIIWDIGFQRLHIGFAHDMMSVVYELQYYCNIHTMIGFPTTSSKYCISVINKVFDIIDSK